MASAGLATGTGAALGPSVRLLGAFTVGTLTAGTAAAGRLTASDQEAG
jgi:hypothetical protein